jgi:Ca-activated chloride channel family protein
MEAITHFFNAFHFIYPTWLVLILPFLAVVAWMGLSHHKKNNALQTWVDPQLAPFVLTGQNIKTPYRFLSLLTVLGLIAIMAMAGPTWQKRKQAGFKTQHALVIALDLSTSMYATDVQPSRLVRARFELIDLLKQRKEGQTALIVYAGDAFVVSPLTDDTETIVSQAKSLTPNIMPVQGSRAAIVIHQALKLLKQTQLKTGHILLITDEILDQKATLEAVQQAKSANFQTSILAIGTVEGSPIPLPQGGFVKNSSGNIVLPKINPMTMQKVASIGAGVFVPAVVGDQDLSRLVQYFANNSDTAIVKNTQKEIEIWINEGFWLLFLLIPISLLVFRKGYLASISLVFLLFPQPNMVQALAWNELWATDNQRGQQAFQAGEEKRAADLFSDSNWKASAAYKSGDFETALQEFSYDKSTEGLYNGANTLVKLQKIPEAIAAYEQVLKLDKNHIDAKYNLELLKKKQQEQQKSSENQSQQNDSEQQNKDQESKQGNTDKDTKQDAQENKENADQKKSANQTDQQAEGDTQNPQEKAAKEAEKKALEEWNKQQAEQKTPEEIEKDKSAAKIEQPQANEQAREQEQATEQWLRRIPDDPTGLWQRKFKYQYNQGQQYNNTGQTW